MTRDVFVTISGTQFSSEMGEEPIEVISKGDYFFKNNKHYVVFEELLEGSSEITKSTLKFSEKEVSLKRSGAMSMQLLFNLQMKTMSDYRTPFGNLVIGIDTKGIACDEQEEKIDLDVAYALEVNYEYLADCRLKVSISPVGKSLGLYNSVE